MKYLCIRRQLCAKIIIFVLLLCQQQSYIGERSICVTASNFHSQGGQISQPSSRPPSRSSSAGSGWSTASGEDIANWGFDESMREQVPIMQEENILQRTSSRQLSRQVSNRRTNATGFSVGRRPLQFRRTDSVQRRTSTPAITNDELSFYDPLNVPSNWIHEVRPGSFRYFQPESERRPSSSSATFTPAQAANNRASLVTASNTPSRTGLVATVRSVFRSNRRGRSSRGQIESAHQPVLYQSHTPVDLSTPEEMARTSQMIESARQQFGELGAGMTYFRSPSGIQIRRDRNYSAPVAASSLTPARSGRSAVRASATGSERSLMRTNQMSRDTASAYIPTSVGTNQSTSALPSTSINQPAIHRPASSSSTQSQAYTHTIIRRNGRETIKVPSARTRRTEHQ